MLKLVVNAEFDTVPLNDAIFLLNFYPLIWNLDLWVHNLCWTEKRYQQTKQKNDKEGFLPGPWPWVYKTAPKTDKAVGFGGSKHKMSWNVNVLLPQKQSNYYLVPENIWNTEADTGGYILKLCSESYF